MSDLVERVAIIISGAPFATEKSRKKARAVIRVDRAEVAAEIREAAKTSPYAKGRTQEFIYGLQDGYEAAAQVAIRKLGEE